MGSQREFVHDKKINNALDNVEVHVSYLPLYYMLNKEISGFLNKLKVIITSGLRRFISSNKMFPHDWFYFPIAIVPV